MNRQARRDSCKPFLKRAGSLPAAMELAASEGFRQNTSVWLGALGELLAEGWRREETPPAIPTGEP